MPSRPEPPPPQHPRTNRHLLIPLLTVALTVTFLSVLVFIVFLYRKLSRSRTTPFDHQNSSTTAVSAAVEAAVDINDNGIRSSSQKQQRKFSYSLLRRATGSFTASNRLGHGGFGSVYKATLPSGESLAVKVMDSEGSLQGEREFHNELSLALNLSHPHILSLLGFSTDRRGRNLCLVYELMPNRSLQEALLDRKCPELMAWKKRFSVVLDVARGLEYLHDDCDPPVIHGDVKPSNVLLDSDFNAKIGDFGLARLKTEAEFDQGDQVVAVEEGDEGETEKKEILEAAAVGEDNGSILEEESMSMSVVTGGLDEGRSPDCCVVRISDSEASPVVVAAGFDKFSVDSEKELASSGKRVKGSSGRDWWWKQDNVGGVGSESGRVKDYVMEWIGSEIKKERPKSEWVASPSCNGEPKKRRKKLDWWVSLDEEKSKKKEKARKPREWWKEEFCEELSKKKKKKKRGFDSGCGGELWWQKDEEDLGSERKKRKSKSKSSRGSIDWWLDGFGSELRSGRRNSQDWGSCGGDIPKSGGISSTPSMRGTVCYVAPEYGGGGQLSEKCDVYSFGVLVLVLISGRRPLQVTASPMSEFERANLISWARQLARNGKLLDLVDQSIHSLDREEALLCITIALLCLQRAPGKRPTMKEIVGMLTGEGEPPHLPFEFSPSPPSNFPFKSRKKAR
ncbi:receptor-like serine/threonine-protein kinase At2g45590 [Argentina anserina]|uniref:receptor-like serine/threonine-protein kinase At2g45590 n=1 Tax=Argentina anserina TaxID=57926 RepID=UPI0021768A2C|nr:receptor-like serine/threonine-protein kinase At2g45590 [Potentilla anserina]